MLAKRIIPCLDIQDGRVVKGVNFLQLRDAGDPVEHASAYDAEGADELVLLDITASHERRGIMLDVVRRVAANLFIPFCVGGGIRTIDDIRATLRVGADKISLNSAAVRTPDLIGEGATRFGSQCIVVAIDPKRVDGKWEVHIDGGRRPTGLEAVAWAKEVESRGAGEILLTSMDRDGTQIGYDIELTQAISAAVRIPVIASGGRARRNTFTRRSRSAGPTRPWPPSLFHFRQLSIRQVKTYLAARGVPVRLPVGEA